MEWALPCSQMDVKSVLAPDWDWLQLLTSADLLPVAQGRQIPAVPVEPWSLPTEPSMGHDTATSLPGPECHHSATEQSGMSAAE